MVDYWKMRLNYCADSEYDTTWNIPVHFPFMTTLPYLYWYSKYQSVYLFDTSVAYTDGKLYHFNPCTSIMSWAFHRSICVCLPHHPASLNTFRSGLSSTDINCTSEFVIIETPIHPFWQAYYGFTWNVIRLKDSNQNQFEWYPIPNNIGYPHVIEV